MAVVHSGNINILSRKIQVCGICDIFLKYEFTALCCLQKRVNDKKSKLN